MVGYSASRCPSGLVRAEIAGQRAALWLGPDEWLLMAPAGEAASLCRGLREARRRPRGERGSM